MKERVRFYNENNYQRFLEILKSSIRGKIYFYPEDKKVILKQYYTYIFKFKENIPIEIFEEINKYPIVGFCDENLEVYDIEMSKKLMTLKDIKKIIDSFHPDELDSYIICGFNDEFGTYYSLKKCDIEFFSGYIHQNGKIHKCEDGCENFVLFDSLRFDCSK